MPRSTLISSFVFRCFVLLFRRSSEHRSRLYTRLNLQDPKSSQFLLVVISQNLLTDADGLEREAMRVRNVVLPHCKKLTFNKSMDPTTTTKPPVNVCFFSSVWNAESLETQKSPSCSRFSAASTKRECAEQNLEEGFPNPKSELHDSCSLFGSF